MEKEIDWETSVWGEKDEHGTLNYITEKKVIEASQLVRQGRVYRLSHIISDEMPYRLSHGPFFYTTTFRPQDYHEPFRPVSKNKAGANIGRMELSDHSGTHIDSLNHISRDGKFYNGIDAINGTGPKGTVKLGIETTPPIVTRGILADICSVRGVDMIEYGPITGIDVETALKEAGITAGAGDALLIYTGSSRLWNEKERFMELYNKSSGIGLDLSKWMIANKIAIAGVDTPSSEVNPPEENGTLLPVHQFLITGHGLRLIDNMKLDEAAAAGLREFMFVCSPVPVRGATASPVSPVAVI